jgi:hypothetical protein
LVGCADCCGGLGYAEDRGEAVGSGDGDPFDEGFDEGFD